MGLSVTRPSLPQRGCYAMPDARSESSAGVSVRIDYEPWLLGFCRWAIVKRIPQGSAIWQWTVRSGRWKWRGFDAPYQEAPVE